MATVCFYAFGLSEQMPLDKAIKILVINDNRHAKF